MKKGIFHWTGSLAILAILMAGSAGCKKGTDGASSTGEVVDSGAMPQLPPADPFANGFRNHLGQSFIPLEGSKVLVAKYETRVRDFHAFLQASGLSPEALPAGVTPDHPASGINWQDAAAFCQWLTETERKKGLIPPQAVYRLPTDEEWDQIAGPERFPWGDKWPKYSERDGLPGYRPVEGAPHTGSVGTRPANALGFHDLGGNVFEWVSDWYESGSNPPEVRREFRKLESDGGGRRFKMLRGASWLFFDPLNLLLGYRYPALPDMRGALYGFRCALDVQGASPMAGPAATAAHLLPRQPAGRQDAALVRGREVFRSSCVECHQYFDPLYYGKAEYEDWMGKMRGKAKLKPPQYADLLAFMEYLRKP